jgi:hypothetical protein
MSAWKLAHPDWKKPQTQDPLPPKGNHPGNDENQGAPGLSHLETGDDAQSAENAPEEQEEDDPLPPKGNQWKIDSEIAETVRLAEMWEEEVRQQKLNAPQTAVSPKSRASDEWWRRLKG